MNPVTQHLGHRQRTALALLADRPGRYHVPTGVAETLARRGLAALRPSTRRPGRQVWAVTTAGYAWLITQAAGDLAQVSPDSAAHEVLAARISQLAALARLAPPVDWAGRPA